MKGKTKRNLIIFMVLAAMLIGLALIAPHLTINDPYATNSAAMKLGPCREYPFGTDKMGRCVFSRVMMGARTSIFCSLLLVAITFVTGTILGVFCGYYGGIADTVIMRLADILLAFPQMVLAIAVAGILGGSMVNAMIALGISGWTVYARLAKSQVLMLKEEEFIKAAKMGGCSDLYIMMFHILPNIGGPLIVNAAMQIGSTMMGFAGLSFLGLGVQLPKAEWGSMISEARGYLQLAPWAVLFPGAAIILTVMIFNYLGDAIRDYLDVEGQRNE